jgi:hypothetical protein
MTGRRRAARTPRTRRARALRVVALTGVVAVATTGVVVGAAAFWRASGAGTGSAVSGQTTSVTLSAGAVTGTLQPGGTADVSVVAANPDPGSAYVPSLVLDTARGTGGFAVDQAHTACTADAFAFTPGSSGSAGWTVPASSSTTIALPAAVAMTTSAPSACQGVVVTVYLKVSGS